MGGFGSTRWVGHGRHRTVDEAFLAIPIRELTRQGMFGPWMSLWGTLKWPLVPAEVEWTLEWTGDREPAVLILGGRLRTAGVAYVHPKHRISLGLSCLPSGGKRRWFLCAKCLRRTGAIYLPHLTSWWGCRSCHGLRYWSQRLGRLDRLTRKADKAWRRLGGSPEPVFPFDERPPAKPKGMHWRTYERLCHQYKARRQCWEALDVGMGGRRAGTRRVAGPDGSAANGVGGAGEGDARGQARHLAQAAPPNTELPRDAGERDWRLRPPEREAGRAEGRA